MSLLTILFVEVTSERLIRIGEFLQQSRTDREEVASCQSLHFARVSERRAHHHCFVAEFLVIIVDFSDALHAGIFERLEGFLVRIRHVPVENSADKRRNQRGSCIGACDRL